MRSPIPILGLAALLLCPALVVGQSRRNSWWSLPWYESQASHRQGDVPLSRLETRINRRRPNVYGTAQSLRLSTRPDRLRMELATKYSTTKRKRRERGLLSMGRPSMSRVAQMLDRRNLLQSRSMLGRSRSALMGRQDYILEENGRWRGEVSPVEGSGSIHPPRTDAATNPRSYSSRLSERLKEKANRYYKLGAASFREGQYSRSQDYFKLVRQLESDRPRAFVANVLVSLHRSDVNTAVINLIHAIHRAKSLADLKVERKEFYVRKQDFQRVVDSVNLRANSGTGTNKAINLMLAYYSFLNGDLITAISAAKAAEKRATSGAPANMGSDLSSDARSEDPLTAAAKRFSQLLVAARDQGRAPDGGG